MAQSRITRGAVAGGTCLVLWVSVAVAGMLQLTRYSNTAGSSATPPNTWPEGADRAWTAGRFGLVMFVHPRCPCTMASLRQLSRVLADCRERIAVQIIFTCPTDESDDWARSSLWRFASRLPDTTLRIDRGGVEAARFGAKTSGDTLLFDADGRLLFQGGVTAARGHEGDNIGGDSVVALVNGRVPAARSCPVFGCGLIRSSSESGSAIER